MIVVVVLLFMSLLLMFSLLLLVLEKHQVAWENAHTQISHISPGLEFPIQESYYVNG